MILRVERAAQALQPLVRDTARVGLDTRWGAGVLEVSLDGASHVEGMGYGLWDGDKPNRFLLAGPISRSTVCRS